MLCLYIVYFLLVSIIDCHGYPVHGCDFGHQIAGIPILHDTCEILYHMYVYAIACIPVVRKIRFDGNYPGCWHPFDYQQRLSWKINKRCIFTQCFQMFPVVYQQNGVLARTDDIGGRNAGKKFRYIFKDFFLFFTACQKDYSRCKQDCRCHHGFEQISHNYLSFNNSAFKFISVSNPTHARHVQTAPTMPTDFFKLQI